MEFLKCKACGSSSMVPVDVAIETEQKEDFVEEESRFYTCHVCGDNWLSVRQVDKEGLSQLTFVHQMGVNPVLKRIAHMQTPILTNEETVDHWEYFLGDDEVDEEDWMEQLNERRQVLKAVCTN